MKRLLCAALLVSATAASASAESYVCVADHSTGFKWNGKAWEQARFTVERSKFVIAEATNGARAAGYTHVVKEIGSNRVAHQCTRELFYGTPSAGMVCGGLGYGFIFNFNTLRFYEVHTIGYIDGRDSNDDTPYMTIGKCTKL